jgi:plasmid stability protein
MASLSVRNLDDDIFGRLKRRAARHRRSAEAEVCTILSQALSSESEPTFDERAAAMRHPTAGRTHMPAEVLLRESRDER